MNTARSLRFILFPQGWTIPASAPSTHICHDYRQARSMSPVTDDEAV